MSTEQNMALARRFMEARVMGYVDALEEMLPPTSLATPNCFPKRCRAAKA